MMDLDRLLDRPVAIEPDPELGRFLADRRALVTGAGGSIGSELARQLAATGVQRLFLLDRSEPALFRITEELRALTADGPEVGESEDPRRVEAILADLGDERVMGSILDVVRPDLVVHAAAHKHVSLLERHPAEAIRNNTLATAMLADAAVGAGVERFVLVSTDKAVRSRSVMGASKRLAELIVQDRAARSETIFAAVRFGNVIGSSGSVLPRFRQQIAAGGPLTVTDPRMHRYLMSMQEAAQLVLTASSLAEGGEIFVLDMGEPVKILDLAEKMIRLSGFEPYEEIDIVITGRRPGEKLFEELGADGEGLSITRHPKIFEGRLQPYEPDRLARGLERLRSLVRDGDGDAIRAFLGRFLPEADLESTGPSPVRSRAED